MVKKEKNKTRVGDVILIVAVAVALLIIFSPEYILPKKPANIELASFSDLVNKNCVNVEIILTNTGEVNGRNIAAFVRCRDQNGTILFNNTIRLTSCLLRPDETCSGTYRIPFSNETKYITHTIEIRWDTGMNAYRKKTTIRLR